MVQPTVALSESQRNELLRFLDGKSSVAHHEITLALGWTDAEAIAGLNELCLRGRVLLDREKEHYYVRDLFPEATTPRLF